uniref:Uncharacterized protein n=1 Tax=viral metagenome TaxID=1070528 RepID=A0A6H1ZEI0_9ZZZZ
MLDTWTSNGIRGRGNLPPVAGNFGGTLALVAGGWPVWQDFMALEAMEATPWPHDIMVVNDIGIFLPRPLTHWVSYHSDQLPHLVALREGHLGNSQIKRHIHTHGAPKPEGAECRWEFEAAGGTSTLFGVRVALAMGYDRVVLCGAPMDSGGHAWTPPPEMWVPDSFVKHGRFGNERLEQDWLQARDNEFSGRVRSLSGRTREWLGCPNGEWLNGFSG